MKILAFFAHPDDETMLCGGTLALLAREGASIDYLCATRGEGGELGDPPLCARAEAGRLRSSELACAVEALGGGRLDFLPYVDPVVGPDNELFPFTDHFEELVARLQKVIVSRRVDALISHGSNGEYGHPAHRLCHRAASQTINRLGSNAPLFYTVQATYPGAPKPHLINPEDPAHLVLDISAVFEQKVNAALCHKTQNALFVRRASEERGQKVSVPEVIIAQEALHRAAPPVNGPLIDGIAHLLRISGAVTHEREN